ncbi:hypothetical protein T02_3027 [Trichinella nativa]|uniref:Uncharacterized protein n=1 Tax=Trichinella nativa TaxID=6335 RepID=A0A0V1KK74_9BILA|nr:hypothetical protein T02_3027 [Trichinella nativa]
MHSIPPPKYQIQLTTLGVASGYAPGQIKICIFPQATPKAFYCTIFDLRVFLCKFLIASGPRRRLRLCPRANKNLHIPACYSKTTPRALPLVLSKILKFARLLQYSSQRRGTPHTYLYLYAVALQSTYLDDLPLPLTA